MVSGAFLTEINRLSGLKVQIRFFLQKNGLWLSGHQFSDSLLANHIANLKKTYHTNML
jgi:hypothetical protein